MCLLLDGVWGNSNKSYIKSELNFTFFDKGIGNIAIAQFLHLQNMGRAYFT